MKLTTKERKAVRELLILAKTRLWDGQGAKVPQGKYAYICTCIHPYIYVFGAPCPPAATLTSQFIHARLSGFSSLVGWLKDADPDGVGRGIDERSDAEHENKEYRLVVHYTFNAPKLQATRHAWIDSMIAELT